MPHRIPDILGAAISAAGGAVVSVTLPHKIMAAFGIAVTLPEFAAGMLFAVAGGFVSLAHTPPEDRVDKFATLGTALVIGLLAAILHPALPWARDLPVQAFMGICGIASHKIFGLLRGLDLSFLKGPAR